MKNYYSSTHLLSIAIMSGIDYMLANVPVTKVEDERLRDFFDRYKSLKREVADYLISNSVGIKPQENLQSDADQYELDLKAKE